MNPQEITTMFNLKTTLVSVTLAIAAVSAFAQTATPRVDQREANQQSRIAEGAASGQLTPKETNRLEKQQAKIDAVEAKDKADGKVTKRERARLHRMQDRASQNIHAQKHDAQVAK